MRLIYRINLASHGGKKEGLLGYAKRASNIGTWKISEVCRKNASLLAYIDSCSCFDAEGAWMSLTEISALRPVILSEIDRGFPQQSFRIFVVILHEIKPGRLQSQSCLKRR
jgi:hypothetical protein